MASAGPVLRFHPGAARRTALGALLLFFLIAPSLLSQSPPEPADQLVVKYLAVAPGELGREMERLRAGALVKLPRDDFDALLRRARAGPSAALPQLADARYRATLTGATLTGSAQWRLTHGGRGPAIFPMQPLNLALRQPRFVDAVQRDALAAEFDGSTPGLLLDSPGDHTIAFDWSARGEVSADGVRFHLETPPCAVASLELELPADVTLLAEGPAVTGPMPAEAADRRLWRVAFARRPALDLRLRRAARPESEPPAVFVRRLRTVQTLQPDAVEAEFRFDVQVPRGPVTSLTVLHDPALRPYEVFGPHLTSWQVQANRAAGEPAALLLSFAAPLTTGSVVVRAVAPIGGTSDAPPWSSPWARLAGAVPGGEELEVRVHPDVSLEAWAPGAFRLESSTSEAGGQVLKLVGGLIGAPEAGRGRPSARVRAQGSEFRAHQQSWWRVSPERSLLTSAISYEVIRGRLFSARLELPPDHEVIDVQAQPAELLRGWEVRSEKKRTVLVVELRPRPPSGDPAPRVRLLVQLRGQPALVPGARPLTYAFPELVPQGVRSREGGLAVDLEEQRYEGTVSEPPPLSGPPRDDGPWGPQVPEFYYPYQGRSPRGALTLRPLPVQLRARATTSVVLTAGRAAAETTLHVQADAGATQTFDLYVAASVRGRWDWKALGGSNGVAAFEPLPGPEVAAPLHALAAREPLGLLALLAARPAGEWRRLILTRPLGPRETLTLQVASEVPRTADGAGWEVPLVTVPTASRMEGEAVLHLAGANLVQVEALGLREAQPSSPRGRAAPPWRTFRYGPPPLALTLRGRPAEGDARAEAAVDRAALTTTARPDGRLLHHYRFQLWNWRQQELAVRLPAGVRLLAVKVDGSWLDRLSEGDEKDGAREVRLPVPAPTGDEPPVRRFELVYAADGPAWALAARLHAPAPQLPIEPAAFRRTWRLPPGVLPVGDGAWRPVPGTGELAGWNDPGRRSLATSPLAALLRAPLAFEEWDHLQRAQLIAAAEKEGRAGRPLGEVLEALACEHPDDAAALVVDVTALEEAGLTPATLLPPADRDGMPFWHALGLVHVPCRAAPLLTSRRHEEAWRQGRGGVTELPPNVEEAISEAAARGHDASGRFRRAIDWARQGVGEAAREDRRYHPSTLAPSDLNGPGGTEWEPIAGTDGAVMTLVRPDAAAAAGMGLAGLALVIFWRLRGRPTRFRLAFVLIWLGLAGLGALWLPQALEDLAWWPLLTGGGLALAWHFWASGWATSGRPRPVRSSLRQVATGTGLAFLATVAIGDGRSQPGASAPSSTTVLVLPAEGGDGPSALVPAELYRHIEQLARRSTSVPRGAVLLAAEYTGRVADTGADLEADLALHHFGSDPTTLALPFSGVSLQDDGLLNGARAYVIPARAPQGGYLVKLDRPGPHRLRLRLRASVKVNGSERELQFGVPRALQTRVASLTLPAEATGFRAIVRQGEETIENGAHRVEIGRVSAPLQFRWRQPPGPVGSMPPRIREAHLWQLRPDGAALTSVLHFDPAGGPLPAVEVGLPDSLVLRRAEARASSGEVTAMKEPTIHVVDGRPRLRLELPPDAPGGVFVVLELVPRRPLGDPAALLLPEPLGGRAETGYLAYRVEGVDAVPTSPPGNLRGPLVMGRDRAALQEFAQLWQAGRDQAPSTTAVHAILRSRGAPTLTLQLRPAPLSAEVTAHKVAWTIGARQAELHASALLKVPEGGVPLVEWDVPDGLTITRVGGRSDPVRHFSRSGRRLQIWLHRTGPEVELELFAWKELTPEPGGARFDLPGVALAVPAAPPPEVHLEADGEQVLEPLDVAALAPVTGAPPSQRVRDYRARSSRYGGRFRVRPATAEFTARVLTVISLVNRELTFTAHVALEPRRGELRTVPLRLRFWDAEASLTETGVARVRRGPRPGEGERQWLLELPADATGPHRFTLTGRLSRPEEAGSRLPAPEVTVPGAASQESWLAVAGPDLGTEAPQRLQPVSADAPGAEVVRSLAGAETERLRSAALWKAEADGWSLRLLPRLRSGEAPPVRVALTEVTAALLDGRHWAHEAACWLYHEANTDLNVVLPRGARVQAVAVDGLAVTPLQTTAESVWVPLPGGAGARCVRLRWDFPDGAETLARPRLERPRFREASEGPVAWALHGPADYSALVTASSPRPQIASSAAGLDLARAEAQYRLSAQVAETARGSPSAVPTLAILQQRFYRLCRYAAAARAASRHEAATSLDGLAFDDWLQSLRDRNRELARTSGFEEVRAEAERLARSAPTASGVGTELPELAGVGMLQASGPRGDLLPARGTPVYWLSAAETAAPQVSLTALAEVRTKRALGVSALFGVLLLAVWGLSRYPPVRAWARLFWPEELVLLALVGWQTYGPAWPLALLAFCGIAARLWSLLKAGVALLHRAAPAAASSASGIEPRSGA